MTRTQEIIEQAKKERSVSQENAFFRGATWADDHPSERTLSRAVQLYQHWFTTESGDSMMEYINKHWNKL